VDKLGERRSHLAGQFRGKLQALFRAVQQPADAVQLGGGEKRFTQAVLPELQHQRTGFPRSVRGRDAGPDVGQAGAN
jgi:hypothetical protein